MQLDLSQLARSVGYSFQDNALLLCALTHCSHGTPHNERLEFLGDSVLGSIISTALFHRFPKASEGELTRLRAHLVCGKTLAEMAKAFDLGDYLLLGVGERRSGGFSRTSILAGALEALIGAIFLEAGIDVCEKCVLGWYQACLENLDLPEKDPKTKLQEWVQKRFKTLPQYLVSDIENFGHTQIFHVVCEIKEMQKSAKGEGPNRRLAEQMAAEKVWELLLDE